ncbi:MAG: 50S ribosomal protein L35 [Clostridia bacterium]|nr:50S ribosomal protein L35 [Clostridia bacterium]
MMKLKSHRASAKRFTLTKSGLVKMNHSHHRHNLGIKTAKRKRHLRTGTYLSSSFAPTVKKLIAPASK